MRQLKRDYHYRPVQFEHGWLLETFPFSELRLTIIEIDSISELYQSENIKTTRRSGHGDACHREMIEYDKDVNAAERDNSTFNCHHQKLSSLSPSSSQIFHDQMYTEQRSLQPVHVLSIGRRIRPQEAAIFYLSQFKKEEQEQTQSKTYSECCGEIHIWHHKGYLNEEMTNPNVTVDSFICSNEDIDTYLTLTQVR